MFRQPVAFDTETTLIVGHEPPDYILGAASDGVNGFFLTPELAAPFITAHQDSEIILHNAPFDLAVLNKLFRQGSASLDIYTLVDRQRIWDTRILHKLYGLATVGHAHQGKDKSTLERCAATYLGLDLPKDVLDADRNDVRKSWGKWKGRAPPATSRVYLQ